MKPRLLYITHCYYNRGGVEEHTRDLASGLDADFDIRIVAPEQGRLAVIEKEQLCYTLPADPPIWPLTPINQPTTLNSLNEVITSFKPDLIHIQHFYNWPLGMLELAVNSGIPTMISFHDYYSVHPIYTIQYAEDTLEALTPAYSIKTLGQDITKYLHDRIDYLSRCFSKAASLVVPSTYLANELGKIYGLPFNVISHGIPPIALEKPTPSNRIRFGSLGSKLLQKGWVDLLAGFAQVRLRGYDCELIFIGGGAVEPTEAVPGVHYHGPYHRSQLGSLLPLFDVGVIPSLFAETFSYVLSEHQAGKKPVAASKIGTLGDRITDGVNGKHFKAGDIEGIADTLIWFIENEDTWRKWKIPEPRLIDAMLTDYRELYNGKINRTSTWQSQPKEQ